MTRSRPSSPSQAYSADSDNATPPPEEGHGAVQEASLSPGTSSDTSEANLPSSCTLNVQSPPFLPGQNFGDLGHSRPLAAISMADRGYPWEDMWAGTDQAAVTSSMAVGSVLQANARRLIPLSDQGAHTKSGAAVNGKVDMPTTATPSAPSSSPSSAISRMVEVSLTAGGRNSGSSILLELDSLPNEVLMHVLSYLDVCDLLTTSRTNHHLRALSLHPLLHNLRLRRARASLPPLLFSPSRPTLRDLIAKHIFLTHTTQISRRLARNLVAIRLSRRLPLRPSAETLVQRGVLPGECVPRRQEGAGVMMVAPGLVAKKRAVERERLKDGLRRWVGGVWTGEVRERAEGVRRWEEKAGVGRVWRLKRFWERVGGKEGSEGTSIAT